MVADARVAIVGGGVAGCSLALPPRAARLGRRRAARAGRADERLDLARGRALHAVQPELQRDGPAALLASSSTAGSVPTTTSAAACASRRARTALDEFRTRAAMAELVGVPIEIVDAERRARAAPARLDGRACSRPRTCRPTATSTRAALTNAFAAGTPSTARSSGGRRVTGSRSGRAASGRSRRPKGEVRAEVVVDAAGQWAGQVARLAGARPADRGARSTTTSSPNRCRGGGGATRASCRCSATRTRRTTSGRRAAGLLVGPFERDPKPWALDGIPRTSTAGCCHPTSTRSSARSSDAAARMPAFGDRGHQVDRQRSRRLHARRPLPDGAGAWPAGLPRAGRLLDLRDRLRRRRRPLRRRVDRRRPAERQHVGARRAPLRRVRDARRRTSSPRASRSTSASTRSTTPRRSATRDGR